MGDTYDDDESLLFNLVYCSRAVQAPEPADLNQLISAAQRHNAEVSITGWLVYSNGVFFQWLEGARKDVELLMVSISADPRHNTIVVLSESEEVRGRVFSGWDMELVSAEDVRAVLLDALNTTTDVKNTRALQKLLKELGPKGGETPA